MFLIPETGKPADLDIELIKTPADADRVLIWLAAVLDDMKTQVNDRGDTDILWLKRLRAAERQTKNLRHRILEIRDSKAGDFAIHQAVVASVLKLGDKDFLEDLAEQVRQDFPHLQDFDVGALKAPGQG